MWTAAVAPRPTSFPSWYGPTPYLIFLFFFYFSQPHLLLLLYSKASGFALHTRLNGPSVDCPRPFHKRLSSPESGSKVD